MTETPDEPLVTVSEFAGRCRVSADTVRRWATDGLVESILLPSGQLRFRETVVAGVLNRSARGKATPVKTVSRRRAAAS